MNLDARIHDMGYRSYDGERRPYNTAVLVLTWQGIQRVLGLKRQFRHKILPIVITLMVFAPAIVFIGMAAFLGSELTGDDALPSFGEYFSIVSTALIMFVAFVAPEALCTDRRTGMLGLYLASPLTRDTYLLGRIGSVFIVVSVLATAPQLLMLLAFTLQGSGPDDFVDFITQLARVFVAGAAVGLLLTSVSMAVSSMTSLRGVASAVIVLTFLTVGSLVDAAINNADAADELGLLDVVGLSLALGTRIYGEAPTESTGVDVLGTIPAVLAAAAWTIVSLAWCRFRYQRIQVRQ